MTISKYQYNFNGTFTFPHSRHTFNDCDKSMWYTEKVKLLLETCFAPTSINLHYSHITPDNKARLQWRIVTDLLYIYTKNPHLHYVPHTFAGALLSWLYSLDALKFDQIIMSLLEI